MATFKAMVLKHHQRNNSTFNIKVRVTHNRKSKYINTNWVVTKDDIKKNFELKNHFFIDETNDLIKKYRDICNKNAFKLDDMNVEQVVNLVTKSDKSDVFYLNIFEYGQKQIDLLLKNGKKSTVSNLQAAVNNLQKFVDSDELDINEITAKFIKEWIEWIMSIKIEPEIMPLFEKYRDKTGKRVFCFYQMYDTAEIFNNIISREINFSRFIK